jgi:hypothetical protein
VDFAGHFAHDHVEDELVESVDFDSAPTAVQEAQVVVRLNPACVDASTQTVDRRSASPELSERSDSFYLGPPDSPVPKPSSIFDMKLTDSEDESAVDAVDADVEPVAGPSPLVARGRKRKRLFTPQEDPVELSDVETSSDGEESDEPRSDAKRRRVRSETSQEGSFRCHHCPMTFKRPFNRNRHETHSCDKNPDRVKAVNCNACGEGFVSKDALGQHRPVCPSMEESLTCECGRSYVKVGNLRKHKARCLIRRMTRK